MTTEEKKRADHSGSCRHVTNLSVSGGVQGKEKASWHQGHHRCDTGADGGHSETDTGKD